MTAREDAASVLVAGIGNLFLGDDGFGPDVVRQLAGQGGLPAGARLVDYGIRGTHLAYDLLAGYDALVLVDACPGAGPPGEVTVLEVGPGDIDSGRSGEFDAHDMNPAAMLANLYQMGGRLPLTFVVGCVPACVEEGIGLSEAVTAAVPEAMSVVRTLLRRLLPVAPARASALVTPVKPAASAETRRT